MTAPATGFINAGDLKRFVIVEQRSTTRTASGDQVATWATLFSAYAAIEPSSGHEKFAAGNVKNVVTHLITMRFDARLTGACRINWRGRYFNITGRPRNIDEDGTVMQFEAQEGLTND